MSATSTAASRSFAAAAAAPATTTPTHAIPTGPWKLYFHESDDKSTGLDSYKMIYTAASWEGLGTLLRELGPPRILGGILKVMRGETSPLWENKANIRGGAYCLKIPRRSAVEVFTRYVAAAAADCATTDPAANPIVAVTISPKRHFCIIKLWNQDAKAHHDPAAIALLHEEVRTEEILYRPHVEAPM
jgi:hypothetical protein